MTKKVKNKNGAVTIEMVAAEAGVSKTTVSFVLNNNPTISEKTRRKVLDIVQSLRYQPNVNARNLSSRKNKTICVVVPEFGHIFEDPYFSRALGGVYDEIEAMDYRITLRKASLSFASNKEFLNLFRSSEISGMIYVGSTLDDYYLADFAGSDFPFVFMNSYLPGVEIPYVMVDCVKVGLLATNHLISLGHKRIARVAGSPNTVTARDIGVGYRKALREAGIEYDSKLEIGDTYSPEAAVEAVLKLLDSDKSATAFMVANDIMAYSIMEALNRKGMRIPGDCAVIGCDNIDFSRLISPPLTSVDLKVFETARETVRLLFKTIEAGAEKVQMSKIIEPKLIIRSSCGEKNIIA